MSIEALWRAQFSSNAGMTFPAGGGVVVFESGRIFGGDSFMYYVGEYEVHGNSLSGTLHIGTHTSGGMSVFGQITDFDLQLSGSIDGDRIVAKGSLVQNPQFLLTADLKRLQDLP